MSYTGIPDLFDNEGKVKSEKLPTPTGIGVNGESAFQVAVRLGYSGTEEQWLLSLKGRDGIDGITPTLSKEAVESVLTGEISTHSHQSSGGLTQAQIRRLC